MKKENKTSIIKMTKFDEENLSPAEYLALTENERRNIVKATPVVKGLGRSALDDADFVAIRVKWKVPKYRVNL